MPPTTRKDAPPWIEVSGGAKAKTNKTKIPTATGPPPPTAPEASKRTTKPTAHATLRHAYLLEDPDFSGSSFSHLRDGRDSLHHIPKPDTMSSSTKGNTTTNIEPVMRPKYHRLADLSEAAKRLCQTCY